MRNLLLIENDSNTQLLENVLDQSVYRVRKIHDYFSLIVHVKEFNPDLVIFNLSTVSQEFINELNTLSSHIALPVMVFAGECSTSQIDKLIQANVSYLDFGSLHLSRIDPFIDIAFAQFKHLQTLKSGLEEARAQLEDRKQIDRAKAILIKTRNFSEDEAYHTLRKLAMGRNITLGEMARNVIAMADLLK
jgi:two-component system, response regulator / RNA-binding antiterminator